MDNLLSSVNKASDDVKRSGERLNKFRKADAESVIGEMDISSNKSELLVHTITA